MRPIKDETWLNVAKELSRQSTCLRRAVGCVLLDSRGHVASTGWNGVASKQPHCNEILWVKKLNDACDHYSRPKGVMGGSCLNCGRSQPEHVHREELVKSYPNSCEGATAPSGTNLDACQAIHAEQNALLQCQDVYELSICYVTHSPCVACTKLLMSTSCRRVVFLEKYAHDEPSRALWASMGREWVYHPLRG